MSQKDLDQTPDDGAGDSTLRFRVDRAGDIEVAAAAEPEAELAEIGGLPRGSALLIAKRGPNAGSRFLLDQPVTSVGRHPGSDIFLDDVTVSRRHAEVRRENGQFQVVDIGSLNGTYVNRKPVGSAVLAKGDEIQIGKYRLVFLTEPPTTN